MFRSIAPPVVGLLLLAVLLSLGSWQLDRAEQKRELRRVFDAATAAAPRRLDAADSLTRAARFQPVELDGRYVADRQALLDAQVHDGVAGYRVWTPFELASGDWVLVDRGWVRAAPDRRRLPALPVDETPRRIRGFAAPLPQPGIRLGRGVQESEGWPRRLAWPDAEQLHEAFGRDIAPALVLLAPDQPDGFVRDWDPVAIPPERHVGYAVQWFALALTLVVIAGVLIMRKRRNG